MSSLQDTVHAAVVIYKADQSLCFDTQIQQSNYTCTNLKTSSYLLWLMLHSLVSVERMVRNPEDRFFS